MRAKLTSPTQLHAIRRAGTGRTAPRTAFVLSGGGSPGGLQLEMLHALDAAIYSPSLLIDGGTLVTA